MYDHYLWYMGSRTTACGFSGLAEAGLPSRPTNDSWYNGSAGCVVLVQEPGHNFGMMHSSSMRCGTATFADDPEAANCTHSEYGDRYDPMGGACNHMNAWQKVFEGWLQKCNGISVKSSGTYTLQPLELACDGPQVLQIPMPKVRPFGRSGGGGLATIENIQYYYLELRTRARLRCLDPHRAHGAGARSRGLPRPQRSWSPHLAPRHESVLDDDHRGPGRRRVVHGSGRRRLVQGRVDLAQRCVDRGHDSERHGRTHVPRPNGLRSNGTAARMRGSRRRDGNAGWRRRRTPVVPVPPPRAEQLMLVNADTDMDIRAIDDMAVIDLSTLPPNLTMRVVTDPPMVGSVAIRIDAGMVQHRQHRALCDLERC